MIELTEVSKTFNQGRPNEVRAVDGIDLAIPAGGLTVFRGPSGSGKTTLLTLIGCLARPTSGRVRVAGEDVSSFPERFLAGIRRRTFGFVFQNFNLLRGISVLENVMVPAYPVGTPRRTLTARAEALLEELGIRDKAASPIDVLSGGEAQRVAIARALINEPAVLIADEPTANLDSGLSAEVLAILSGLKGNGKTVVVTSHDPLVFDSPMADSVVGIRDGRLEDGA